MRSMSDRLYLYLSCGVCGERWEAIFEDFGGYVEAQVLVSSPLCLSNCVPKAQDLGPLIPVGPNVRVECSGCSARWGVESEVSDNSGVLIVKLKLHRACNCEFYLEDSVSDHLLRIYIPGFNKFLVP